MFEHNVRHGVKYGFIPKQLHIKDRPEFDVFPLNVLFMKCGIRDGRAVAGTSLYEPDLASFGTEGTQSRMEYHNIYGDRSWLVIEHDSLTNSYFGQKFFDGESVGAASGSVWNMFFAHLTSLGLTNGEPCEFRDVESSYKPNHPVE